MRLTVVNAGDEGVRLRQSPGAGEAQKVLRDGARVTVLGEPQEAAGRTWRPVRDDTGTAGWIAADFLAPAPESPIPTASVRLR